MNVMPLVLLLVTAGPERLDLSGRVMAIDGEAVQKARVMIYTARVRTGTSPLCPSCYADCSKKAETDRDGSFRIAALDPALLFRVLIVADGFRPAFADNIDPGTGPLAVKLEPLDPSKLDAKCILRGIVAGPDGSPAAGAVVTPAEFQTDEWSGFKPGVLDPLAVTNLKGEFVLTSRSPIREVTVKAEARGLAPRIFTHLQPRPEPSKLTLSAGATVTGRLIKDGQPVANAAIGLVQADRRIDHFVGVLEIATDNDGRFTFLNVADVDSYYVYGMMSSLKDRGAVAAQPVRVRSEASTVNIGDLVLTKGHKIAGQFILSDGKPFPADTRLLLGRAQAWDTQVARLDPEGKFELTGLPTEWYHITVGLRGYHMSTRNHSFESLNRRIEGRVDQDILGLKILMEPNRP